ncbi:hypothetical protein FB45DRAFT_1091503 [Roridomyces roridus]|uniref:F-box domain-containing protein n=1 Tax=Roridomyces roridus TaxID=1738132 RepID=A0AAD7FJL2_9AGAR|nr:hypothetical protein FB45DRAFT_1091503 [Roridomyces roridus]
MRTIPSELVDEIIDRLASVLLAGYPPVPWGLPHTDWLHTIGTLGLLRPGNVRTLFDLTDKSTSDLLSLVHTLHLPFSTLGPPLLEESQLRRLGRSCSRLDAVWIWIGDSGASWEETLKFYSSLESQTAILGSTAPLLSCLTMSFYDLPLRVVLKLVSSLPALETLRLFGNDIELGDIPAISSLPCIRTFQSTVSRTSLDGFFDVLISFPTPPLFETISVEFIDGELDSGTAKYFDRYGSAVQHLEVNHMSRLPYLAYEPMSSSINSVTKLALQQTPNLVTLVLKGQVTPLPTVLSAIASDKVTSVRVESAGKWGDDPPALWSQIDALLSEERFRALRVFRVAFFGMSDNVDPIEWTGLEEVRAEMPLAVARGILPAGLDDK